MTHEEKPLWPNLGGRSRKVISRIKSPLGFFSLALLIVESFLLGAGALFGLSDTVKIVALVIGVFLFLVVVGIVTVLVIRYPQALVFTEDSHLQWEYMHVFGDNSRPSPDTAILVSQGGGPPEKRDQPMGGGVEK